MKKITTIGLGLFAFTLGSGFLLALPQSESNEAITPIPQALDHDKNIALLGKQLFHDPALSANKDVACVSCHDITKGGANNQRYATGTANRKNETNTPSVFNSIYYFRFHWDGRAKRYEDALSNMVSDPTMMGSTWETLLNKVSNNPLYVEQFNQLFNDGISKENITSAFYEYQKILITPNAPFDKYLLGDENALTAEEKAGYALFQDIGCISCHQGVNLGGNLYEKLGVYKDYFADKDTITAADYGKYNVTGLEEDKYVFKVPSLRNVALTAPYFHDGSQETLEDAIQTMAIYQIGKELPNIYVEQISAFLETLTGEALSDKL